MIIIALALILLICLAALNFVKVPMRSFIVLSLTLSMVILNFFNQLSFHWSDSNPHWRQIQNASSFQILKLGNLEQPKTQSFTFIQKRYLNALEQKISASKPFIVHLQGLKRDRLRNIVAKLQKMASPEFVQVSFELNSNKNCFLQSRSLQKLLSNRHTFLLVSNLVEESCFNLLISSILDHSVSVIISEIPQNFQSFKRSQIVQHLNYSNELYNQLSQKYSLSAVNLCNKYYTLDNNFEINFRRSGKTLYEYCLKLRSNRATECIRQKQSSQNQLIPLTKIKACLNLQKNKDQQQVDLGYQIKGGFLKRRKQYAFAKISQSDITNEL